MPGSPDRGRSSSRCARCRCRRRPFAIIARLPLWPALQWISLTARVSSQGKYQVFWSTPHACPGALSLGWYLTIFMMAGSVVYFGGGFVYLKKKEQREGTEAIPHFEFWSQDLPDLVKDGVYFTIEKVRAWQTGKAGYEEIQHKEGAHEEL
eukprot:SAG22_NODE_431_length_10572_cov_70.070467_7_plen_151_part_00